MSHNKISEAVKWAVDPSGFTFGGEVEAFAITPEGTPYNMKRDMYRRLGLDQEAKRPQLELSTDICHGENFIWSLAAEMVALRRRMHEKLGTLGAEPLIMACHPAVRGTSMEHLPTEYIKAMLEAMGKDLLAGAAVCGTHYHAGHEGNGPKGLTDKELAKTIGPMRVVLPFTMALSAASPIQGRILTSYDSTRLLQFGQLPSVEVPGDFDDPAELLFRTMLEVVVRRQGKSWNLIRRAWNVDLVLLLRAMFEFEKLEGGGLKAVKEEIREAFKKHTHRADVIRDLWLKYRSSFGLIDEEGRNQSDPPTDKPTVEFRVDDANASIKTTLAAASITACYFAKVLNAVVQGIETPYIRRETTLEEIFQASRYGVKSQTVWAPVSEELLPFGAALDELLEYLAPEAEMFGCQALFDHARTIAKYGNCANFQRRRIEELLCDGGKPQHYESYMAGRKPIPYQVLMAFTKEMAATAMSDLDEMETLAEKHLAA